MRRLLDQLVRSGLLWDDDTVAELVAGGTPRLENVVADLVIGAMDAEATVRGDPTSTWNEKRIARLCLAVAFLVGIAGLKDQAY